MAKNDKLYGRLGTLKSAFSNHHEIHSFGYGVLAWLLTLLIPEQSGFIKLGILGVLAVIYGYDFCLDWLPMEISADDLPIDIRKQRHYFVLGVVTTATLQKVILHFY